jgi:hypothetical protein
MKIEFRNSDAGIESGGPQENHTIQIPDAQVGRQGTWVQLTYEGLRIAPDGEHVAYFQGGFWRLAEDPTKFYSDVVIAAGYY